MAVIFAIRYGLNTNFLPTEREGRTGEYWPEVVALRTERSEVRTKTTERQYFPVRSRGSEVSKLFIIWLFNLPFALFLQARNRPVGITGE